MDSSRSVLVVAFITCLVMVVMGGTAGLVVYRRVTSDLEAQLAKAERGARSDKTGRAGDPADLKYRDEALKLSQQRVQELATVLENRNRENATLRREFENYMRLIEQLIADRSVNKKKPNDELAEQVNALGEDASRRVETIAEEATEASELSTDAVVISETEKDILLAEIGELISFRLQAGDAIGEVGEDGLPVAFQLAQNENPTVRLWGVHLIGLIGVSNDEVTGALEDAIQDSDELVSRAAREVLRLLPRS